MKNIVAERLVEKYKDTNGKAANKADKNFLRLYYHRLSKNDFYDKAASVMGEIAFRHRELAYARKPEESLIDIFDVEIPTRNGNSARTIINIVAKDAPFIIDSLFLTLNRLRHTPIFTTHPIFAVTRNAKNALTSLDPISENKTENTLYESYIQLNLDQVEDNEKDVIKNKLLTVIEKIKIAVRDWRQMRDQVLQHAQTLISKRAGPNFAEHGEIFKWMAQDHFAFIGYVEVSVTDGKQIQIKVDKKSALGMLHAHNLINEKDIIDILPPIHISKRSPVYFTKTCKRSDILKSSYIDCVLYDHDFGDKKKTHRFSCILGFLSGSSYSIPIRDIPHLRNKVQYVLEKSGLRKGGYSYKELRDVLNSLPREKVFQMEVKALYELCMSIISHQERRQTHVYLNKNVYGHFYSCLMYIPRDLYSSNLRHKILRHLSHEFNSADIEFDVYFSESSLTRIHFTIHCQDDDHKVSVVTLEKQIRSMVKDWNDNLYELVRKHDGIVEAKQALTQFRDAFPLSYQDDCKIEQAYADIQIFSTLQDNEVAAALQTLQNEEGNGLQVSQASFRLYKKHNSIPLSDVLPILENMGVRVLGERPYKVIDTDGTIYQIHDFKIIRKDNQAFDLENDADHFETTFLRCNDGFVENDGFNQLGLLAGLNWRQISVIRAYYRYLKQIRLRYSESYIIDALCSYPQLTRSIMDLFAQHFDPSIKKRDEQKILSVIKKLQKNIKTLDEDRIIGAWLDVLNATQRTNFYQLNENGEAKNYIAFKISSSDIPRIPEPAPMFEIFVYSPRVEGVHLRGGKVARGGLRWSERPEDFRTEVLGLVKAQRVKNAVIVPVGSKGGFVAKKLPNGTRDEVMQEVVSSYKTFISSLLDITDNLVENKVVPPQNVVRRDADDPYLVVAADKGTATFSDIANGISEDYGFWLGDAFASGGSVGYDHKKMGITARGAWESVKRHFREKGKDIQSSDFTVVGIGDMAGDVFGNGMLLSKHIKLLAAFNHMHIFIDPNPDAKSSYVERKRLFDMPRSSWTDYNAKLISKGGGIYSRSDKSITLSNEAKNALGLSKNTYDPNALINELLKSQVELIWNGGIGTYVKASSETHSDAQDKNNDSLRVNANQLRCEVIGEGGNLGMTQLARIEYAQHGGACYTDAIDNSAGVDTSDHEVNIKILLGGAVESGQLSYKQRNSLLAKMENTVAQLVLHNNYMQTQTISIEAEFGAQRMAHHMHSIEKLEKKGLLNRALEYLPDGDTLQLRFEEKQYLTRPELAVLLSYSKMDLYQSLLDSKLPEDAYLNNILSDYFPNQISTKYPDLVKKHRLKREIICTQVTNSLVGDLGPAFHLRVAELTGNSSEDIARAYLVAKQLIASDALFSSIHALDNKIDAHVQMTAIMRVAATLESTIFWLLRNAPHPMNVQKTIEQYADGYKNLVNDINRSNHVVNERYTALTAEYKSLGIAQNLSQQLSQLKIFAYGIDMVDLQIKCKADTTSVAEIYFGLGQLLDLPWLRGSIRALHTNTIWHERSRQSLADQLRNSHSAITQNIITKYSKSSKDVLQKWQQNNQQLVDNFVAMKNASLKEGQSDFAMVSVLVSELTRLAQA